MLRKLDCFRRSNASLSRQWPDVLGVLRLKGDTLDVAWMRKASMDLGTQELRERALAEAGIAG